MKLQEVFDQLTSGEFSQICIGGAAAGVIDETNYSKVVGHVNLGLTALFTRFALKEGRLTLDLQAEQELYKLHSSFAVNVRRSLETTRYIIDTVADRFSDDVIKIEKVLNDLDVEFPLNTSSEYSITTPRNIHLRMPSMLVKVAEVADKPSWMVTDTDLLTVIYRANHPKLVVGTGYFDPTRVELQLPDSHLEALLYYVASRVQSPVGMTQEGALAGQYFSRYEQACQALEGKGVQINQGREEDRISRGGWA